MPFFIVFFPNVHNSGKHYYEFNFKSYICLHRICQWCEWNKTLVRSVTDIESTSKLVLYKLTLLSYKRLYMIDTW